MIASPSSNGVKRIDVAAGVSEEALLSSIVCYPATLDSLTNLRPEHFRDPKHGFVYATARKLWAAGLTPDISTIAADIAATGDLQESLGPDWFGWLMRLGDYGATITPGWHAEKLIEAREREKLRLRLEALQGELTDPTASLESIAEQLRTLGSESVADDVQAVDVADLIADNPSLREPVVEGLLRRGEVANIIAKSKAGKSWLGYSLAFSVALGLNWLGKFRCRPGRALIVDNELHQSDLAFRLRTVGDALGYRVDDYKRRISVITLRGRLTDIHGLRKHIERLPGDYSLVLCDALYRFVPEGVSENDNASMTRIYNTLDAYAATTNAAFVCIGHASKGDQSNKDRTDVGAGAGAQSRAADCHIIVRPHQEEGAAVLEADLRSFAPINPVVMRWSFPLWTPDDSLDPEALKAPETRQDQRQTAKDREGFDAIVSALRIEQPQTERSLRGTAGIGSDRLARLLGIMANDGRLVKTPVKLRGNQTCEYSLSGHLQND